MQVLIEEFELMSGARERITILLTKEDHWEKETEEKRGQWNT